MLFLTGGYIEDYTREYCRALQGLLRGILGVETMALMTWLMRISTKY